MSWEDSIVTGYLTWIKDNTVTKSIEKGKLCAISTPFLDRHNDHVQIYIEKTDKGFILTDDGYTLADLSMSGMEMSSPKREKIFSTILKGFGVQSNQNNALFIEANAGNLAQKKHYLLQAILAVNDMFTLSQENVYSLFKEDVELYFKTNNIIHTRDVKIAGKSGLDNNIDFLVPATRSKPERLIQTVNNPKKDAIRLAAFIFNDVAEIREEKISCYVLYNDIEKKVSSDVLSALTNYSIKSIPWTEKARCLEEFTVA